MNEAERERSGERNKKQKMREGKAIKERKRERQR